jgi:hypothetical protein
VALAVVVDVPVELNVADAEVVAPLVEAVAEDVDVPVALDVVVDVAVAVDVAVPVAVAIAAPVRSSTSHRYVVAVSDTEIIDSISPTSPSVALTSGTELSPFAAETTMSPPPSVFILRIN